MTQLHSHNQHLLTHSLHIVLGVKTAHNKSSCPEDAKNKENYDCCKLGLHVFHAIGQVQQKKPFSSESCK